jgi:deoxyhypusine synthase
MGTVEFCRRLGQLLDKDPKRRESLLWTAAEAGVPIFVPGPTDGAVGSQVWMAYQTNRAIAFDLLADEQALSDLVMAAPRLAGVILGGGISKHHLIWWAQFRDGLDYAVAVTTAVEHDGSLSGARLKEAISWGKLKADSKHVTVDGDATIVFPLLAAAWLGV